MTDKEYKGIVERYLREYEVKGVEELPDLVKVDIVPYKREWGLCTFIFAKSEILCFGDIESYAWSVTWDAAEKIRKGNCYAKSFGYLFEKLEHYAELEEFEITEERLAELKNRLKYDCDYEDFKKKWDEYASLLDGVDSHHLEGLDEFLREFDEEGYEYYDLFTDLPDHYYAAVAMLRCIEDYFEKKGEKE